MRPQNTSTHTAHFAGAVTKIIRTQDVERLRQKARKLKRSSSITHAQALDAVAKEAGFEQWHQVILANNLIVPAETAFRNGAVLIFEMKDVMDTVFDETVPFEEDHLLEWLCKDDLFDEFTHSIPEIYEDEVEREEVLGMSETQLQAEFAEWLEDMGYSYVRLKPNTSINDIEQLLKLTQEHFFFMPVWIRYNGSMVDTHNLPSYDANGNMVALRLS